VPDVDAAVALLREQLAPGDVVLVKGSRSAGLERVAAALLEPGLPGSGPVDPALEPPPGPGAATGTAA
jgi:UDP-N-acetylmuramoyl-tripeptide--D-alanyl-D-alanine ligase